MKKISICSKNKAFAEDLMGQIKLIEPEIEITETPDKDAEIILVDEDKEIINSIREQNKETPIILFSSHTDVFEASDMVIRKPFRLDKFLHDFKEGTLLPKIRRKECISFKEYHLYPAKKEIEIQTNGKLIKLTEKEVIILKYLYQNAPDCVSKEDLLENVWGYCADVTTHTIETHIYRLRQKVEQEGGSQLILTENNGYRLNV